MKSNRIGPTKLRNSWLLLLIAAMEAFARPIAQQTSLLRGRRSNVKERRQLQSATVSRVPEQLENLFTTVRQPESSPPPSDASEVSGMQLVIGVNFKVSSTSDSKTDPKVETAELEAALEVFGRTLMQEWDYRNLREVPGGEHNRRSGGLRALESSKEDTRVDIIQHHRRLQVSFVEGSSVVDEELVTTSGCVVNVNQEDGNFHCNEASGRFNVLATEDENMPRVCRNMETSVEELMADDFLQEALLLGVPRSDLVLSIGTYDSCIPLTDFVPPETTQTTAPPTRNPTFAPTPPPNNNVFDNNNDPDAPDPATTTAPTAALEPGATLSPTDKVTEAPTIPTTPAPSPNPTSAGPTPVPAPTIDTEQPTEEFVDNWLAVLNGEAEDPVESGNPWLDVLDSTTGQDDDVAPTPAPGPANYSGYAAEMARLREEYWDDGALDQAILIISVIWAALFIIACCIYGCDGAWIIHRRRQVMAADEEHWFEGRWYYDEKHKFRRSDMIDKGPPEGGGGSAMFGVEESSSGEEEDSIFLSSSEEESDDLDFDFDESDSEDEGEDSGNFYVDEDDDEEEDEFEEDEDEGNEDFDEETEDFEESEQFGVYGSDTLFEESEQFAVDGSDAFNDDETEDFDESSDFFNDESTEVLQEQRPLVNKR